MNDDEIIKDMLKDLEEMSIDDLIEALEGADDWGLGELLGNPLQDESLLKRVEEAESSENSTIVCKGDERFEGFENDLGWFKDAMDQSNRREHFRQNDE